MAMGFLHGFLGFQSTSPVRGTTAGRDPGGEHGGISIHVPREGDDHWNRCVYEPNRISIHVPREGDDWPG